ncbi:hypothetical protein [Fodinicola feengrottensis]|uniref:Uncharacterized protein n=1 Tax=Fodinicola feengrottensis TaxID=435914 RepID=A0ABP4UB65_9ACTN|nr:hypothetical protein [Fodinicola feengrottensis]
MTTPKPGTIGLSIIRGRVGLLIRIGEFLNGNGWTYTHTWILAEDDQVFAAYPGGASYQSLASEIAMRGPIAYVDIPVTDNERAAVLAELPGLAGTPYSYLEYLALAARRLGVRSKRLDAYIASAGHMICSQLAAEAYRRAGVIIFKDGRLPQDVTPGDFASLPLYK